MARLVLPLLALLAGPAAAAPAAGDAPAQTAPADSRTIVGEIVWVDAPARLVMIRESVKTTRVKGQPSSRQTVAVSVSPQVAITRGKAPVALEALKAKDHVTARYVTGPDGARALSLRVAEAAPSQPASAGGSATAAGN